MKICPICEAKVFEDMATCFNCMHRFDLFEAEEAEVVEETGASEMPPKEGEGHSLGSAHVLDVEKEDTEKLALSSTQKEVCVVVANINVQLASADGGDSASRLIKSLLPTAGSAFRVSIA